MIGIKIGGISELLLMALIASLVFLALFGRFVSPYDPIAIDLKNALMGPRASYWFGTDELGRDVLSRVLSGARTSLVASGSIVVIAVIIGGGSGFASGFVGGLVDAVYMRMLDVVMAFPGLLLALVGVTVFGPGLATAVVAVGISEVPAVARLARSVMLTAREQPYVESARLAGASELAVLLRHLVPNCVGPLVVQASLIAADSVLIVAGLGYLGLGAAPPTPEWGAMLSESQVYLPVAPYLAVFPGAAILLTALAFNAAGERLRVAFRSTA